LPVAGHGVSLARSCRVAAAVSESDGLSPRPSQAGPVRPEVT
jgi:hypothetical protein